MRQFKISPFSSYASLTLATLFLCGIHPLRASAQQPINNANGNLVPSHQKPKQKQKKKKGPVQQGKGAPPKEAGYPGMMSIGGPEPYSKVITKDAKTQKGLFLVHQIKSKILWEIPKNLLNRDLFWSTELAGTPAGGNGFSVPGVNAGTQVLEFQKHDNKLWLREMDYSVRTDGTGPIAHGVARVSISPIIDTFPIEAYGKKKSMVIDVTRLFLSDPPEFEVKELVGGSGVDPTRSAVLYVHDFPKNIETSSQLTFVGGPSGALAMLFGGGGGENKTAIVHYSLDLLPKVPMEGRLADDRVGYFKEPFTLYDTKYNSSKPEAFIDRFHLVKKFPNEAVSVPVKPIVYYISREVPNRWRPYLRKAVLAWNSVFAKLGYKDVMQVKDAPTKAEDPNWSPEDIRYNVIRWQPTDTENAEGQSVHDPRSGQTLCGHVVVWGNVTKLAQMWYFAQASASDPLAQFLPLSQRLVGRILTYIVTHEVGHTLGLAHNFLASSEYPTQMLRNKAFTEKYGDEASIMDYGRFNYVAQPGDGARLIPILGPYDYFAIGYGYMPEQGPTPESERPALDHYLAQQVTNPMVRFGTSEDGSVAGRNDPSIETEDLGSNPILSTTYGLKNIDRIAGFLYNATVDKGKPYSRLQDMYSALLSQRFLELIHVSKLVGGVYYNNFHGERGGQVFVDVSKAKQKAAVQLLLNNGLHFPAAMLDPRILNQIHSAQTLPLILSYQKSILSTLLADTRCQRMFDNELMNGSKAYTVQEMVAEIQSSIWSELRQKHPIVDLVRRNLQSDYLYAMDNRLNGAMTTQTEFRAIARMDLIHLQSAINSQIPNTTDMMTRAHLMDCSNMIKKILNGKSLPKPAALPSIFSFLNGYDVNFEGKPMVPFIEGVSPMPQAHKAR